MGGANSMITDLTQLIDFNYDGLNFLNMANNSIYSLFINPLNFYPEGQVIPAKYHTKDMNMFWFIEQIGNWLDQKNYWQPVQKGDILSPQFQTNGLSPVVYNIYSCSGTLALSGDITDVTSGTNAIISPRKLWQIDID